jgi:hypothetical protein
MSVDSISERRVANRLLPDARAAPEVPNRGRPGCWFQEDAHMTIAMAPARGRHSEARPTIATSTARFSPFRTAPDRFRSAFLICGILIGAKAVSATDVQPAEPTGTVVTCRVNDDERERTFVLRRASSANGATLQNESANWRLSMRERESKDAWIDLKLPGAQPKITETSAALSYKNANGGRQVDLEVTPQAARLDVWVDYGLDVNIEPDMDPRVDRINTGGQLTALACTIRR